MENLYGAIEAGGTKFVCMVATSPKDIKEEITFTTSDPINTIAQTISFLQKASHKHGTLKAIGVASFGPLDLEPTSDQYGYITSTPKPGWQNTDIITPLKEVFSIPIGFDTDVNGAALGEWRWGAAQGLHTFIYLTVGTGIGGGGMVHGELIHGLLHPEMGHIFIPHDRQQDPFPGVCPFHKDCLEGLASGPAIQERWGKPAAELEGADQVWDLEAQYLALGLVNFICTLSPQRIILGGGVMHQKQLLPLIRAKVLNLLNGYIQASSILDNIDQYVVAPELGDRAGVLGGLALAEMAA